MPQITDSRDVYRQLVEESDENWLYGLLAFAIIEEQRIEWMDHFEKTKGNAPSVQDIEEWYKQQPTSTLLRAKGQAESALGIFSSEVAEKILLEEQRDIIESAVISEVRMARRFWPQFGISFVGGMTSALIFAAILAVLTFFVWTDPSPTAIIKNQIESLVEE